MKLKNLTKEEKTSAYARCGRHGGKRTDKYPLLLTALVLVVLCLTCCSDEISYRKLPEKARNFIEIYFPEQSCVYAERDRDNGQKEYEVRLSNGTEIEFYESGDWKSVDCKYSFLPEGIVPETIVADIAVRYPGAGIYEAEREAGGYEISIGNGLELIYSADGRFIREERF
ncbi:hypothetical protein C799_03177 [Bacteroides thetaiotaomicron dnLKV9]|uniref:Putative beta-lactamase-inhibitor-like PepSY-like domain-containing protein n=1 Tax=Bacteroides thetaiotaomicron dnLKV9 TaxID=1235785 RepID=R9H5F6_BACT4|nr:PepSY-like domain-containing protein [Bacteroides thetaiotaomicron]EOR99297.1 hypothetical protein C799_03177 [Bacteroides thetaiotaomicron dnLKV9]MDC2164782.1 PepSY-like domain-containing protein [Bacteroides thetaiotaomicron]